MLTFGALFLILAALLICAYCFRTCFYAPKNRQEDPYALLDGKCYENLSEGIFYCTRSMEEAPCEFVEIRSYDGTTLSGRYYHHADDAPVMILFHGYRSMALRDCAGGYILGKKAGFNVLAVDQRAHGRSGGRVITFGIRERKDCLSWILYINERFGADTPIVISGLSMGAATVLMAADLDLPENVACIMADCPYSSPAAIIRKVAEDMKYPSALAMPFIRLSARLFGGFRLDESSAENSVRSAKIPILIMHGESDDFVPCEMSRQIAKNAGDQCQLHTFPGAGHGLCYTSDPQRYEHLAIAFLSSQPSLQNHLQQSDYVQKVLQGNL